MEKQTQDNLDKAIEEARITLKERFVSFYIRKYKNIPTEKQWEDFYEKGKNIHCSDFSALSQLIDSI